MKFFILFRRLLIFTYLSLWIPCFRLIFKLEVIRFLKIRRLKINRTEFFVSRRYHCGILSKKITERLRRFFDSKICGLIIYILYMALKLSISHTWSWRYRWDDVSDCNSRPLNLTHGNAHMHCLWRLHLLNFICRLYSFLAYRWLFVNYNSVVSTLYKWLIFVVHSLLLPMDLIHDVKFNILCVHLKLNFLLIQFLY